MFSNNKKKLDLANAAKEALEKEHEAQKKAHEATKVELQRMKAENESMREQLGKAIDVAGSAVNGRWYTDDGRYCGEIKMPRLFQPTGTILTLKVNDDNGLTKGFFIAPNSTAKLQGNRLEWDNSPDDSGAKIWTRKDDPASGAEPNGLQLRVEELQRQRDEALAELSSATQALQDNLKKHEALRRDLNVDPSQVDGIGENRAMKVEMVKVKGDLEASRKDLEAAWSVADGLRQVIDGQKGEVEHARRQRTTWEQDKKDLDELRSSQTSTDTQIASLRRELDQTKKDFLEANTKAEEMAKSEAAKNAELEDSKKKWQEEIAAHEELKTRHVAVMPENEALRSEAEKQKRKSMFSVQAHEFVIQAHETLRAEHVRTAAEYGAMRAEHEQMREDLEKIREENLVVKAKYERMEAHLQAISIEHEDRKKEALDLVGKLEQLKIKYSLLERENMEQKVQLSSKHEALQNMQSSLQKELTVARQIFDTPYSEYLRSTKGHASMGIFPASMNSAASMLAPSMNSTASTVATEGLPDMSILPGAAYQGHVDFHPTLTQIVIGRVGQVVVEN